MKTYTINTECGLMRDIRAENVDAAKAAYIAKIQYDFDGCAEYPGSWYWIEENGFRVEEHTDAMP